jgi:hypothetical protein
VEHGVVGVRRDPGVEISFEEGLAPRLRKSRDLLGRACAHLSREPDQEEANERCHDVSQGVPQPV